MRNALNLLACRRIAHAVTRSCDAYRHVRPAVLGSSRLVQGPPATRPNAIKGGAE